MGKKKRKGGKRKGKEKRQRAGEEEKEVKEKKHICRRKIRTKAPSLERN